VYLPIGGMMPYERGQKVKKFPAFISRYRKVILVLFDILAVLAAYMLPWIMIQGRMLVSLYYPTMFASCFFFVCCFEIVFAVMGMYDSLWRYAEVVEFFRLVVACIVAVGVFIIGSLLLFPYRMVPISVYFLSAMFATSITPDS